MIRERSLSVIGTTAAALLFALALSAPRAVANSVTYDFTSDHCSGGCGTSPFGSVALTQVGSSVDVVVTLFNGNDFVKTNSGDDYAFKFVGLPSGSYGGTLTSSDVTITSPTNPGLVVDGPGSYDGDGTGNYAFGITCPSCKMGAAGEFGSPIDFTVANATIAELTIANNDGFFFTADIISGQTRLTGPVAATGPLPAPEASTVTLASVVLLAFGVLLVRSRRNGLA